MSKLGYVNNKGLLSAIRSEHEIMLHCQQAYVVIDEWVNYLTEVYQ